MKAPTAEVDRESRRAAFSLVRGYLRREVSNDELVDRWPVSGDPALREISHAIWCTYDDLYEHLYRGGSDELLERCASFLESDEPYRWRVPKRWLHVVFMPLGMITFGQLWRLLPADPLESPQWPLAFDVSDAT